MRRWETYVALIAVTLASLSVFPVGGHPQVVFALAAIGLIAWIGFARLRALGTGRRVRDFSLFTRVERIREARLRRFGK
ncbi:MAG: hypothetical protein M3Y21_04790 [Candidatus Eremiobacteraeota bacterium]|nr:hypothetical protein [Candidatus Eremiobacteraeota bacterium]